MCLSTSRRVFKQTGFCFYSVRLSDSCFKGYHHTLTPPSLVFARLLSYLCVGDNATLFARLLSFICVEDNKENKSRFFLKRMPSSHASFYMPFSLQRHLVRMHVHCMCVRVVVWVYHFIRALYSLFDVSFLKRSLLIYVNTYPTCILMSGTGVKDEGTQIDVIDGIIMLTHEPYFTPCAPLPSAKKKRQYERTISTNTHTHTYIYIYII